MHFGGTSGRLLLRCEDRMTLYEQQSRKVLAELQVRRRKNETKRKKARKEKTKLEKTIG